MIHNGVVSQHRGDHKLGKWFHLISLSTCNKGSGHEPIRQVKRAAHQIRDEFSRYFLLPGEPQNAPSTWACSKHTLLVRKLCNDIVGQGLSMVRWGVEVGWVHRGPDHHLTRTCTANMFLPTTVRLRLVLQAHASSKPGGHSCCCSFVTLKPARLSTRCTTTLEPMLLCAGCSVCTRCMH